MKKLLALLAVVLCVVSCQTEPEGLDVNVGGEIDAIVNVTIPEAETRATNSAEGAFKNVDFNEYTIRYILQVYYKGEPSLERLVKYSDGKSVAFDVRLVPGRDYQFVVWADVVDGEADVDKHYNTADLENITLNDTLNNPWVAMDETRDAFTATVAVNGYSSASNITVKLQRPFAKLRVVTTDMVALNNLDIVPTKATVTYSEKHYNAFNAFAGEAIADTKNRDIKHEKFVIADYGDNTDKEMVLFTDYFFAAETDLVKFNLEVFDQNNVKIGETVAFNTDIPVNANYLTTIKGNILTDGKNFNVTIDDAFAGENKWPNTPAGELVAAAMFGGEITLTENVRLTEPLNVTSELTINLNGKTITTTEEQAGRHHYAILNNGTLSLEGDGEIIARGVKNFGTMTVDGNLTIKNVDSNGGAAIWNEGELTINNGTFISSEGATAGSYGAALNTRAGGKAVVNGGTFEAYSQLTYAVVNEGETVIYNATVKGKHGAVAGAETNDKTTIYGGSFELMENPGVSDHCTYYVSAIYGGTFSLGKNTDSGAKVFYESTIAAGYKALAAGGIYYVLPETIANAAEAKGVTAVTESTADVATALATNNGEATLFMWNDVAYIAKYGEVVIVSDADEATTVRSVVEGATGLTSATVADGIEVVGNRTFRKCANLETVALPNTLTEIGPAVFQSCSKLANITIPESVTTIGEGAFAECTALTSINIPAGITHLEKDVLRNTGLVSVEIPASVNYIGTYAFRDCESLTEINILSPEFTIESNTFTNMAAPVPTMTIHVVNAEMKAYLESVLSDYDKSYITVVGPTSVSNADALADALANGGSAVMTDDIETEAATTAPYGNKYAYKMDGGTLDGNGHELHMECYGDDYGIMTSGGTIKNLTIEEGCRAVMIMYPTQDVILDNVNIGGDGVLYPINTGEAGSAGVKLVVTNSTLAGWTSFSNIESASFTNVEFKQGTYYNNIYGRVLKPYVNTTLTDCSFIEHMNLDLSELINGQKVTFKNCTVNGQVITASTFTVPSTDAEYDTELFTIDLPSWASSVNDCVIFE